MDSLITAAAHALAEGDPLGALNRVALPVCSFDRSVHSFHDANSVVRLAKAFGSSSQHSSSHAADRRR